MLLNRFTDLITPFVNRKLSGQQPLYQCMAKPHQVSDVSNPGDLVQFSDQSTKDLVANQASLVLGQSSQLSANDRDVCLVWQPGVQLGHRGLGYQKSQSGQLQLDVQ